MPYLLIGLGWLLAGPLAAGRLAMMGIGWLWILGVHVLAGARQRSAGSAILASTLFFGWIVQYGFYSFLLGGVAFLAWVALQRHFAQRPFQRREWGIQPLVLLLL
jgi:hypothetical protein